MKRCLWKVVVGLALTPLLLSCRGSEEIIEAPFSGSGELPLDGLIAVIRLDAQQLPGRSVPAALRRALAECETVDLMWLDSDVFGAPLAVQLSGGDPAATLESLIDVGYVEELDDEGTRYTLSVASFLPGPVQLALGGSGLPSQIGGGGMGSLAGLKRYDRDGRVLLVPTVDLREDLLALGVAADRDLDSDASLAVAIDGRQLARFVEEKLLPTFDTMSSIASGALENSEDSLDLELPLFGSRLLLEVLHQIEGMVLLAREPSRPGVEVRLTARESTPLADLLASLRPVGGETLRRQGPLLGELEWSVDPVALASAGRQLLEPALEGSSKEFRDEALEWVRTRSAAGGRIYLATSEGEGFFDVALSLQPDVTEAEVRDQLGWLGRSGTIGFRHGWVTISTGEEPEWSLVETETVPGVVMRVLDHSGAGTDREVRLENRTVTWLGESPF